MTTRFARLIAVETIVVVAAMYAVVGDGKYADAAENIARALGDTLARVQKDDGSIRTQMLSRPDADNFWINCMGASIMALDLLSKY